MVVAFDAPPNSDHFIVKSSADQSGSNPTIVGNPTDNNLVIVTETNATKHYYQVVAVNKNHGQGAPSAWTPTTEQVSGGKKEGPPQHLSSF